MPTTQPAHTAECFELGALLDLTTEMVRRTRGRGEIPEHLGLAAQDLCLAQAAAHRTCVTLDAMSSAIT